MRKFSPLLLLASSLSLLGGCGGFQWAQWNLGAYPPPGPDTIIVNILP